MSDLSLKPASALAGAIDESRSRVSLELLEGYTAAHLAARKGADGELSRAFEQTYGIALPGAGAMATGSSVTAVWAGPSQWLIFALSQDGRDLEQELRGKISGGLASIADQSDARTFVRVSGPSTRQLLAKLLPIDVHPRAFDAGSVAITHAAHIGVMVWRSEKLRTPDCFMIACSRSYAHSFWHALMEAAGEFGVSAG